MLHLLQRHPLPVRAWFQHSLVLTYAFSKELLEPLLPPGVLLDTYGGFGFVAVAMVQTRHLRPAFLPRLLGKKFFLTGYRIFARFETSGGRRLRGLRILRSDADSRLMVWGGNLLTHYHYRLAKAVVEERPEGLAVRIRTPRGEADVDVVARLSPPPAAPPPGSPFADWHQARLFAGPLPFTFDFEPETNTMVIIEGVRQNWSPQPVAVEVRQLTFFNAPPFDRARPVLANAFYVKDIPYAWKRGVVEPVGPGK